MAPIDVQSSWQLRSGNDLPPTWQQQQKDLKKLSLIRTEPLPDSFLGLKLSSLSEPLQRDIARTGLLGDSTSIPLITILVVLDGRDRLPDDYPAEDILSVGLPTLRLLRTLQHHITAGHHALVQTATLVVTHNITTCFLHSIVPGEATVQTAFGAVECYGQDLAYIRMIHLLENHLRDNFIQALTPSSSEPSDSEACLDEWVMTDTPAVGGAGRKEREEVTVEGEGEEEEWVDEDSDRSTSSGKG
ncbi:hypothetical protein V8E36_007587, partial [Tilletia maclaganii]